ncbi:hypothetical protein M153_18300003, partial [Pseudoloma neurophilia]
ILGRFGISCLPNCYQFFYRFYCSSLHFYCLSTRQIYKSDKKNLFHNNLINQVIFY